MHKRTFPHPASVIAPPYQDTQPCLLHNSSYPASSFVPLSPGFPSVRLAPRPSVSHLSVPSLTSLLLSLPHCRTPEPVYSTVNKLCDRAPSPRHYSPFELNKSLLHSTPLPSYHLSLFPDSDISRYFLLPCSPLVCQCFPTPSHLLSTCMQPSPSVVSTLASRVVR